MLSLRKTKTATRHGDWGGVNMGGRGWGWLGVYEGVFGVSGGVLDMGGKRRGLGTGGGGLGHRENFGYRGICIQIRMAFCKT